MPPVYGAAEVSLYPVAALVRLGTVAGDSWNTLPPSERLLALYRWFPHKCHQFATNPAGGQSAQALGRTKGGLNTKLCAVVEGDGRLMAAAIASGQPYEVEAASPVLDQLRNVLLVGDKGFDSDALRQQMLEQGCLASIPPRSGRRAPAWYHRGFYRQRHKIENFFQRIKIHKRISTRYEKLAITFLNFLLFGAIFDWLK